MTEREINALKLGREITAGLPEEVIGYFVVGTWGELGDTKIERAFDKRNWTFQCPHHTSPYPEGHLFGSPHEALEGLKEWIRQNPRLNP